MTVPAPPSRSPGVPATDEVATTAWERYTGIAGMLFVLLLVADIFLGSAPSDGSSPGKLVSFYVKHDTTVLAATYLQIVIAIVFVAFLVGLYSLLRRAEGAPAMLSTAALGL